MTKGAGVRMFPAHVFWDPDLCVYVAMFSSKGLPCFLPIVSLIGCGLVGDRNRIEPNLPSHALPGEASGSWVPWLSGQTNLSLR